MKRRDLLRNLGLGSAGLAVSANVIAQASVKKTQTAKIGEIPDVVNGVLKDEIIRNNKLNAQVFFNKHEMATIAVLTDIIIPADATSGSATKAGVPAFIEFIVKDMPSHQVQMRGGLMWLDNFSKKTYNKKFLLLTPSDRLKIIDHIAYPQKAKPEHSQGVSFFNLIRNLTATGFFTSEIGMKDLGYVGNVANKWDGVPDEVLAQYKLDYKDWQKHLG